MTSIETTTVAAGADSITNTSTFESTDPTHQVEFVLTAPFSDPASWFFLQRDFLASTGLRVKVADGSGAKGIGGQEFTYRMLYDVTAPHGADLLVAVAPGVPDADWTITVSAIDGEKQAEYRLPADKNTVHHLA